MNNASQPFDFSQFVPGFDFLKNLAGGGAGGAAGGAVPGLPSLASWVAPTLSVEEVDKRIQELKTVQYWLEQNGHALKATIQALEVQKMTLSTLRGMNVRMEDIASAFTKQAAPAAPVAAPPAEPEPEVAGEEEAPAPAKKTRSKTASASLLSAGASRGSGRTCAATCQRLASRTCARAALVREPSSRATLRIAGQGTRLNRVTLSTGPLLAMQMPGTRV